MSENAPGRADSGNSSTDKGFSCDICGDTLSHPSHVTRHKRLNHPDELEDTCPTCGEAFASRRGVKLHHKRTHGTSLKDIESATCKHCGNQFEYDSGHRTNPDFCNADCRDAWQTGENHPNYQGGKVALICEECNRIFRVNPNKSDQRFCDDNCRAEWHSRQMSGKDNHFWNGGKIHYYGPNWKRQRRKARERDNHTCQDCGVHEDELDKAIPVHHIMPRRKFLKEGELDYEKANALDNLISLCPECHRKWEGLYLRPDTR